MASDPGEKGGLLEVDRATERWVDRLPWLNTYVVLAGLILISLLAYGFVGTTPPLRLIVIALHGVVLILALHLAHVRGRDVVIAAAAVAVVLLVWLASLMFGNATSQSLIVLAGGLLLAVPPAAILRDMRRLLAEGGVTIEAVFAAVSVYLLVGAVFAYIYAIVPLLGGGPFFAQVKAANAVDYVYFSFTTIATLGYGDLTAAGDPGRMLSVFEALIGQLYLVTVVALLVSNLGQRARERRLNTHTPSDSDGDTKQ